MIDLRHFDPLTEEVFQNPYPFYQALRSHASVFRPESGHFHYLSRYADIKYVVMHPELFSSNIVALLLDQGNGATMLLEKGDQNLGPIDVLAIQDPPLHGPQRKLVSSVFTKAYLEEISEQTAGLIRIIGQKSQTKQELDWMTEMAWVVPMSVALWLVGLPMSDREQVKRWSDDSIELLNGIHTQESLMRLMKSGLEFYHYCKQHVGQSATNPPSVLMERLQKGQREQLLSADEASSIVMQLLIAGSDSSASVIGTSMLYLVQDNKLQETLRQNPAQISDFIEEILRLESPFQGHFRVAKADAMVGTVPVKKGERLMLLWASANRDEAEFSNPEQVDLSRKNLRNHLAFGYGLHHCLGAALARMEAQLALKIALELSEDLRPNFSEVRYRSSMFVRTLTELPIQWIST
jgi:cytochrome P450 family 144